MSDAVASRLLTVLLEPDRLALPLSATDKEGAIAELAALVTRGRGDVGQSERVVEAVRRREAVLSTGIGGGVALPHGKTGAVAELILAAGTAPGGIEFDALDGKPVHLLFMLVGPGTEAPRHVKALSRLGRILKREELRAELVACRDPGEFVERIRRAEAE